MVQQCTYKQMYIHLYNLTERESSSTTTERLLGDYARDCYSIEAAQYYSIMQG